MSDIIHNKEELMEVVREAADAVFDAWFRVMEREEKKKREQVPLVKGYQEERTPRSHDGSVPGAVAGDDREEGRVLGITQQEGKMIEWLLSYLRKMTDEQKRELAKAFLAPSPLLYQLMENSNLTVRSVDEFIKALEKMRKEELPCVR